MQRSPCEREQPGSGNWADIYFPLGQQLNHRGWSSHWDSHTGARRGASATSQLQVYHCTPGQPRSPNLWHGISTVQDLYTRQKGAPEPGAGLAAHCPGCHQNAPAAFRVKLPAELIIATAVTRTTLQLHHSVLQQNKQPEGAANKYRSNQWKEQLPYFRYLYPTSGTSHLCSSLVQLAFCTCASVQTSLAA